MKDNIFRHIRRWNKWRKGNLNSHFYQFLVLIGFVKSPTMALVLLDDEDVDIHDILDRFEKENNKMKNFKLVLIIILAFIAVVLFGVFGIQGYQNKAITLEEQVETAQSDIQVQEKRRVDLVYNLADCVKQYDAHEAQTLKDIVEGRSSSGSIEDAQMAIAAVSEAYPELKANENYKELMNELAITENLIAEYRSNFNTQVKEYNRYVRQFPARIFLSFLGYEEQDYTYLDYEAPSDAPQNLFED